MERVWGVIGRKGGIKHKDKKRRRGIKLMARFKTRDMSDIPQPQQGG